MNPTSSLTPVQLRGLDPQKKYSIREINLYPGTGSSLKNDLVLTGEELMTVGFNPDVNGGRMSVVVEVKELK